VGAAVTIFLAPLAGCAAHEPLPVDPGISNVPMTTGSGRAPTVSSPSIWERAEEARTYRAVGRPFLSRGHFAGRWRAQVAVNDAAEPIYMNLRPSSRFPSGAVLVKRHFDAQSGALGPVFARIKREPGYFAEGDDWEYLVVDELGHVEQRGPLPLCARCHAEGLADATFGLPADAR
jgi:hypothetical protein